LSGMAHPGSKSKQKSTLEKLTFNPLFQNTRGTIKQWRL
jgi:hypothetical protein